MGFSFTLLGSGSTGNTTLVSDGTAHILVDIGLSGRETARRLREYGLGPENISAVVVSHEHGDHCRGVGPFVKNLDIPVFMTEGALASSGMKLDPRKHRPISAGERFDVCGFDFTSFSVPHDAVDPLGFVIEKDGARIATVGTNDGLLLCSLTDEAEPLRKTNRMMKSLAFSRDGRRLALSSNASTVFQYDANSLAPVSEPIDLSPNVISSLAYSPDNQFIAIGDRNSNIHLWRLEPAQPVTTLVGHQGPISDLDFSLDGQKLASASEDSHVYLWDLKDGKATRSGVLPGELPLVWRWGSSSG